MDTIAKVDAASRRIFSHRTMKRHLKVLAIPVLASPLVRWMLAEHGACGYRKSCDGPSCPELEPESLDKWARRLENPTKKMEYTAVVTYLRTLKEW